MKQLRNNFGFARYACFTIGILAIGRFGVAQEVTSGLITRTYGVRFLVSELSERDWEAGQFDGLKLPTTRPALRKGAEELISRLRQSLPADNLKDAQFQCDNKELKVIAPAGLQEVIAANFRKIKADFTTFVVIEMHEYALDVAAIQSLRFPLPQAGESHGDSGHDAVFLKPWQRDVVRRAVIKGRLFHIGMPHISTFNHRVSFISVSDDQSYVAGYAPSKSKEATGFDPVMANVPTDALKIELRPSINFDRNSISLQVRAHLSHLFYLEDKSFEGHPDLRVKIPREAITDLDETVEIPGDESAIFAGDVDLKTGATTFIEVEATIPTNPVPRRTTARKPPG